MIVVSALLASAAVAVAHAAPAQAATVRTAADSSLDPQGDAVAITGGFEELQNSPQHTIYVMTAFAAFQGLNDAAGNPTYAPMPNETLYFAVEGEDGIWFQLCTATTNADGVAACSGRVINHVGINGVPPTNATSPDIDTIAAWSVVHKGNLFYGPASDYGRVQGTPDPSPTPPNDGQPSQIVATPQYNAGCVAPDPNAPATLGTLLTDGGNCQLKTYESIITTVVFSIVGGILGFGALDLFNGVIGGIAAAEAVGNVAADAAEAAFEGAEVANLAISEGAEGAADAVSDAQDLAQSAARLARQLVRVQSGLFTALQTSSVVGGATITVGALSGFGQAYTSTDTTVAPQQSLQIGAGTTLTNTAVIYNQGTITDDTSDGDGVGSFVNNGVIVNTGSIPGGGSGNGGVLITGNNYTIDFDSGAGSSEAPLQVFAPTVASAGQSLPAPTPPTGSTFAGWVDSTYDESADGYDPVTDASGLSGLFGPGPVTVTLKAIYAPQDITVGVSHSEAHACNLTSLQCLSIQDAMGLIAANPSYFDGHDVTLALDSETFDETDSIDATDLSSLTIHGQGVTSTAVDGGGAGPVLTVVGGTVDVSGTTILGGSAPGTANGGGVLVEGGTLTLNGDDVGDNSAAGGEGGGVFDNGANLVMTGDTVEGNTALGGGGVASSGGSVTLTNDTFAGNSSTSRGGAVFDYSTPLAMVNDTLAGNTAVTAGNGIGVNGPAAEVSVANSILDDNNECWQGASGTLSDQGYNVEADSSCGLGTTSSVDNATIDLTSLEPIPGSGYGQGASTPPIFELNSGSSAAQEVPLAGSAAPETLGCTIGVDETGQARPSYASTACDAGAEQVGYYSPSAPSVTGVQPGDGQATVTISPSASKGGLTDVSYDVVAHNVTDPNASNRQCSPVTTVSCTVTNLTDGDEYTFTATADNRSDGDAGATGTDPVTGRLIGEIYTLGGTATSVASAPVTPIAAPGAPSIASVAGGDGEATVAWADPATYASPVSTYLVTAYQIASPGTVVPANDGNVCSGSPADSSCEITGLTDGAAYVYVVSANNPAGTSVSHASAPVVAGLVPAEPSVPSVTGGDSQATVTWTAPEHDGGAPITGYTVTSLDSTNASNGGQTCTPTPVTATSCTLTGLTNGDSYTVTVVATNGVGSSEPSASSAVVPATTPGAPGGVMVVGGDQQARVSWAAPSSDGGSAVTGYTVTVTDSTSAGNGGQSCTPTPATGTSCTLTSLTNGDSYTVTVTARNAAGPGDQAVTAGVVPATGPGAPTGLQLSGHSQSASVSWAAPADNGGSAVTGYTVTTVDTTTAPNGGQTCSPTPATATSCMLTGLTNGDSYTVTVVATNRVGSSGASVSADVVPATVPDAPGGLVIVRASHSAIASWSSPIDSGGSPVTGYTVSAVDTTTAADGGQSCTPTPTTGTSCTLTGLTNGDSYTVTVVAQNRVGSGQSAVQAGVVPAAAPNAPTGVSAVPSPDHASISWHSPVVDGGSPITSFTVTAADSTSASRGRQTCQTSAASLKALATTCTISELTIGDRYTFTVTASNAVGSSLSSAASPAVVIPGRRPTVSTVSPASGPVTRRTRITLTGTHFVVDATAVLIGQGSGTGTGALMCADVTAVSSTELKCTAPNGAKAGTWNVFVRTKTGGTSVAVANGRFTYLRHQARRRRGSAHVWVSTEAHRAWAGALAGGRRLITAPA